MLRRNFMAFQSYLEELGCTNKAIHCIDTGDSAPVRHCYQRIPLHKRPVVEAEVNRMLDQGVIKPSQSPWSSNIVLVWKPRSKNWRVCSDFRWINSLMKKDAYPLPRIHGALEMLEGATGFVSLGVPATGKAGHPWYRRIRERAGCSVVPSQRRKPTIVGQLPCFLRRPQSYSWAG